MAGSAESNGKIRVKFLARPEERIWRHQLPDEAPVWDECEFIFDPDERNYDWLVVYDDLPPAKNERRSIRREALACSRNNTILVTSEPSSIKSYFTDFTDQFGFVLTSQPDWALPHPNRLFQQPALQWFYGVGSKSVKSFSELQRNLSDEKSEMCSIVGSSKQQKHTLHALRFQFIAQLRSQVKSLRVFGREDIQMDDKADAVKPFRFHVAVENHYSTHHWTEKLADAFLGEAVPIYIGCPNIADYFPGDSYILADISDAGAASKIIDGLTEEEYLRRLPSVLEAKRRVLFEYNLFAVLSKTIQKHNVTSGVKPSEPIEIVSRRALIKRSPIASLRHLYQKTRLRLIHRLVDRDLLSNLRP